MIAFAQSRLVLPEDSQACARRAIKLARQCGDELGLGNALNVLSFSCRDIAERQQLLQQAVQAFERAGYIERRTTVMGNLCLALAELGLYQHAFRQAEQLVELTRRMGARHGLTLQLGGMLGFEVLNGDVQTARARWPEYEALVAEVGDPTTALQRDLIHAHLQMAEGEPRAAIKALRAALPLARRTGPGHDRNLLVTLARACLAAGDPQAAVRAIVRGIVEAAKRDQRLGATIEQLLSLIHI